MSLLRAFLRRSVWHSFDRMAELVLDKVSSEVQSRLAAGDYRGAVARAIEGYGPELLGFLVAVMRDADAADDVFSETCEQVWRSLTTYRWEGPLRAWMYAVARHTASRYRRDGYERRKQPLPEHDGLIDFTVRGRTLTRTYLRTANASAIDRLREQLNPDDRALLVLRLDRKMTWNEIVLCLRNVEEGVDEATLQREAASLRKQFERIKNRLKELARVEGLLDP